MHFIFFPFTQVILATSTNSNNLMRILMCAYYHELFIDKIMPYVWKLHGQQIIVYTES